MTERPPGIIRDTSLACSTTHCANTPNMGKCQYCTYSIKDHMVSRRFECTEYGVFEALPLRRHRPSFLAQLLPDLRPWELKQQCSLWTRSTAHRNEPNHQKNCFALHGMFAVTGNESPDAKTKQYCSSGQHCILRKKLALTLPSKRPVSKEAFPPNKRACTPSIVAPST